MTDLTTFPLNEAMFIRPRILPLSAWTGHVPFGSWLVGTMRPSSIVELGTHKGTSFLSFCQSVQENGLATRCYAVDTWEGDIHAGEYGDAVYNELRAYHEPLYGGFAQLMRMTFDEASDYFPSASIDILHIDGLHTYEAVKHDFESWKDKLSNRAVVLFHDTHVKERNFGVWKFWREICTQYPSFEFAHSHGLGVLAVGADYPEALDSLFDRAGGNGTMDIERLFEFLGSRLKVEFNVAGLVRDIQDRDKQVSDLHEIVSRLNSEADSRIAELLARDAIVQELSSSIGGASSKVETLASRIDRVVQMIDAERSRSEACQAELGARLQDEHQSSTALFRRRVADLETAIFERDERLRELDEIQSESDRRYGELEEEIARIQQELLGESTKREGLELELEIHVAERARLADALEAASKRCSVREEDISRLQTLMSEMTKQLEQTRSERDRFDELLTRERQQGEDVRRELNATRSERDLVAAELAMAKRSLIRKIIDAVRG